MFNKLNSLYIPTQTPRPAAIEPDYEITALNSSSAPTSSQLHHLTSVPSGLVHSMNRGSKASGRGRSKRRAGKLDTRVRQVYYNEVSKRPIPRNGLSLEQSITMEFQTVASSVFTTSVAVPVYSGSAFSISNFSTAGPLGVFDQYRIEQFEIWLEPRAAQGTTVFGQLGTCIDLDDATAPTTQGQVSDRIGALAGLGSSGRYHKWKPHMAVAVYSGAFTSFANEAASWIDSASSGVLHYGFKTEAAATPVAIPYDLTIRAVISFRAPDIA